MEKRRLGRTGLEVSAIGLGGVWFSSKSRASESALVIRRATDLGVNMIDTAPGYEDSEEVVGLALPSHDRKDLVLTTKYYPYGEGDRLNLSGESFARSLARSFERLGVSYIDGLYLHWVHGPEDVEKIVSSDLARTLQRFKSSGHVGFIGISEASEMDGEHRMLEKAIPSGLFDAVMVTYNVLLQTAERKVFALARDTDTGVVVMMPLNQPMGKMGLVSRELGVESLRALISAGALPSGAPYDSGDALDFLTADGGISLPQAAIRFALDHPAVSCVLAGTSSVPHLEENLASASLPRLSEDVHRRARELFSRVTVQIK